MGTRADFYVQPGDDLSKAIWQGSIAWDGYPGGVQETWRAGSLEAFGAAVDALRDRDDWSDPERDGWPWPWEDSCTTDFAYVLIEPEGRVAVFCFGRPVTPGESGDEDGDEPEEPEANFPDMTAIKRFTMGKRSGLIVLSIPRADA